MRRQQGGYRKDGCGIVAAERARRLVGKRAVVCVKVDRARYKRSLAVCSVGNVDLADWLVRGRLAE